jgi:hypothetical protein
MFIVLEGRMSASWLVHYRAVGFCDLIVMVCVRSVCDIQPRTLIDRMESLHACATESQQWQYKGT